MIVVLQDNGQVSLPTRTPSEGGGKGHPGLSAIGLQVQPCILQLFQNFCNFTKGFNRLLPEKVQSVNKRIEKYTRCIASGGTLFKELVFYYLVPVDRQDIDNLVPIFEKLRYSTKNKPVLLHIKITKGVRYPPAERDSNYMHRVSKFDLVTGSQMKSK